MFSYKKIIFFLLLSAVFYLGYANKSFNTNKLPLSNVDTFINRASAGSATTLNYWKGGITSDSMVSLPAKLYTDTTSANFAKPSNYSGALIMLTDGSVWVRRLTPTRRWVELTNTTTGTGTVTDVSFTNLNGISGVVTNPTTTPNLTLSLGNITPTSIATSGGVTASFYSGTWNGNPITTPYISSGAVTYSKIQNVSQPSLLGSHNGPNTVEEIILGTGLSFSGGTLNSSGGTITSVSRADQYGFSSTISTPTTTPVIRGQVDTNVIVDKNYFSNIAVKYSDTSSMLANRLKISDTSTMLSPYARTSNLATSPFQELTPGTVTTVTPGANLSMPSGGVQSQTLSVTGAATAVTLTATSQIRVQQTTGGTTYARIQPANFTIVNISGGTNAAILSASGLSLATGTITTSALTNTMTKMNSLGTMVAAVPDVDYVTPSYAGFIKPSDTASMLTPYAHSQAVVKYADTASMLSNLLRKTDTVQMLSGYARNGQVVKYSDTASMLANRLKISDTAQMLSPYARIANLVVSPFQELVTGNITSVTSGANLSLTGQMSAFKYTNNGTSSYNTGLGSGTHQLFATTTGGATLGGNGSTNDITLLNSSNNTYIDFSHGSLDMTHRGNIYLNKSIPIFTIDGRAASNSGAQINLLGWTTSFKNWQISVAKATSGLDFIPSTVVGGNVFTGTQAASLSAAGDLTTASSVNTVALSATGSTQLNALTVTGGASVTGGLAATLTTAAQTNITSLGTLSSLNVSGTATAGTLSGATVNANNINLAGNGTITLHAATDALIYNNASGFAVTDGSGAFGFRSNLTTGNFTVLSGSMTAASIIKTGGASTDALKADGSVTTLTSGTYTPTITVNSNVSSTTAYPCQYMRVGNVVTVSGQVQFAATVGATTAYINVSLPITSNFSNAYEAGGTGLTGTTTLPTLLIYAKGSDNKVVMSSTTGSTSNLSYFFTFTYQII